MHASYFQILRLSFFVAHGTAFLNLFYVVHCMLFAIFRAIGEHEWMVFIAEPHGQNFPFSQNL